MGADQQPPGPKAAEAGTPAAALFAIQLIGMRRYQPRERLAARHKLIGFSCRSEEQTELTTKW